MPLPRQAQGRPGTPVIPTAWAASHAGVVDETLQSQVTIRCTDDVPTWNEGRGQTETTAPAPVYDGHATLMLVTDTARAAAVAEDTVASRVYEVTLPYDASADVQVGMVVTVGNDPDPMLVGRTLTLSAVERGTRRFSRVLLAVLND